MSILSSVSTGHARKTEFQVRIPEAKGEATQEANVETGVAHWRVSDAFWKGLPWAHQLVADARKNGLPDPRYDEMPNGFGDG